MSINGMMKTLIATQIAEAVAKDEKPEHGGCDVSAGMFGTHLSAVVLDIAEALAPTCERFFCNKCGYHGKDQNHLKPDTLLPCHYLGAPGMQTFVVYAWHVKFISPGRSELIYHEDDLKPWTNNKNVKEITPLYKLQK